ncbi:MAG: YhgE/Pip domain-containing protein [Clostridiaceae bacterium]
MNFLKIAWRDISSIFKNRFIRVSVIAIIIVPLLYSLLYLAAFWDPYSKLQNVSIAVVNLDKGALDNDKTVNYGNDIIVNLKGNNKVGWKFTTLSQAEKGLKGNDYYAVFIIPEDFSQKSLSAKIGKPEQPKIIYSSNDKKNFIGSQVDAKIALELKDEISKNITDEYTKVTFDNLYDLQDGLNKAADGSNELYTGITSAKDGSGELKDGLQQMNDKVPELSDGVSKLFTGSYSLSKGIVDAKTGASQLNKGIGSLNSQIPALTSGISKLNDGSYKLKSALKDAQSGSSSLKDGLKTASAGASSIYNGIVTDTKDSSGNPLGLKAGMNAFNSGLKNLGNAITTTENDPNGNPVGLNEGAKALDQGINTLNTALNTTAVDSNGNPLGIKSGAAGLAAGAKSVSDGVNKMITGVTGTQTGIAAALQDYIKNHPEAAGDSDIQKISAILTASNTPEAAAQISALKTGAENLSTGAQGLSTGITALSGKVNSSLVPSSAKLAAGTSQVSAVFSSQLLPSSEKLTSGVAAVGDGMGQLSKGIADAASGSAVLNDGLTGINSGASDLNIGISTLYSKMPDLSSGINILYTGSGKLVKDGMIPLYNGSLSLKNGLTSLKNSIPSLSDGVQELFTGSGSLYDGLVQLQDGSKELYDKLQGGSSEINKSLVNDSSTMGKFVSDPVILDEKPINAVKNYGTGFTPYFIPLSLWVGAIMMFFVITDKVDSDIEASSASIAAGKFLSYGFIGILQAVLVSTVVLLLGLKPHNIAAYFLFNIFMSYVFIAIIQSLVFLLGQAGKLLSIVLLILQLTSCAGTFPLEVVPKFFKVINPYLPFTYCVSALREIISGSDNMIVIKDVTILAAALAVFLLISILMKGRADKIQEKLKEMETQTA